MSFGDKIKIINWSFFKTLSLLMENLILIIFRVFKISTLFFKSTVEGLFSQ